MSFLRQTRRILSGTQLQGREDMRPRLRIAVNRKCDQRSTLAASSERDCLFKIGTQHKSRESEPKTSRALLGCWHGTAPLRRDGGLYETWKGDICDEVISTASFYRVRVLQGNCRHHNLAKLWRRCGSQLGGAGKPHVAGKEELDDLLAIPAIYMACILLSNLFLASWNLCELRQR
jgi:hypothetical protein